MAGGLLAGLESLKEADNMVMGKVKKGQISHSGILRSAAGLLCLGKTDFTDIETCVCSGAARRRKNALP